MNYGRTVFSEVGIGVVARTGASVQSHGLLAVTQDFGLRSDSPVFLVGVAYDDADGNGICDPGEGIPGIKVMPASGNRYAVTSASGGYAIPFAAGPGNSSVTFSGGGLAAPVTRAFSMTTANVKVDLVTVPALPDVTIAATDAIAGEKGRAGGGAARVRISRTGSTARQLEISISRSVSGKKGKASPSDYPNSAVRPPNVSSTGGKANTFHVTIPAGRAHADLKITAVRDKRKEPVEKLVLTLSSDVAWQAGTPKSAKISIRD